MFTTEFMKKVSIILVVALTLIVGGIASAKPQAAVAADLVSSYDILKNQYPAYIDRIKAGGATEEQIRAFLRDLQGVLSRDTITEANFNDLMLAAVQEVILWPVHEQVYNAMIDQYYDQMKEMATTRVIPAEFMDMRNALLSSLLSTDGTGTAVGGGGGGSSGNSLIAEEITDQLNRGVSVITLSISSSSVTIPGKSMQAVKNANKPMEITFGSHLVHLPARSWPDMSDSNNFYLTCTAASTSRGNSAVENLDSNKKILGSVMEINSSTDDSLTGVNFSKNLTISLSYKNISLSGIDENSLDVFYYNEGLSRWESQSGTRDRTSSSVTFETQHLSLYAIIGDKLAEETGAADGNGDDGTASASYSASFMDISGHWAENDIKRMSALGFVSGMSPAEFAPDRDITRAEFAALLVRILKISDTANMYSRFSDVTTGDWYYNAVNTAAEAGLVSGITADTYAPNEKITREQMAVMVARALDYKGLSRNLTETEIDSILQNFTDAAAISPWARSGIAVAYDSNIVKGRDQGRFDTQANATRAEAVAMLARLYDQL